MESLGERFRRGQEAGREVSRQASDTSFELPGIKNPTRGAEGMQPDRQSTRSRARRITLRPAIPPVFWFLILLAAAVLILAGGRAEADDELKLKSLRTDYLHLVYFGDQHYYIVPHLVRCFQNSLNYHRNLFDYDPSEDVTVILQDMADHG